MTPPEQGHLGGHGSRGQEGAEARPRQVSPSRLPMFGAGWGQPGGASGQGWSFGTGDLLGRLENSMGNFLFAPSEAQLSKKLITP